MAYHNVIYTTENGKDYANFFDRIKTIWNARWFKDFDIEHPIVLELTKLTASGDETLFMGETAEITLTAEEGYTLPSTITVSGADYTYEEGVITLTNPTGAITIVAEGVSIEQTL